MKKQFDKFKDEGNWDKWIGRIVIKHSKKPFKNGNKIQKPIGITTNPYSGKLGFKFKDDTIVDSHQCRLLEIEEYSDAIFDIIKRKNT